MSCLGKEYIPIPPRVWFRVENQCPLDNSNLNIKEHTLEAQALEAQMSQKGNVLQYKKNSSNLTQNQRYAKIARGQWTNRHTTWATQSDTTTNPNTKMLKRNGTVKVAVDLNTGALTETTLPLTACTVPSSSSVLVIQDGGTLQCNVQENVCTGKTVIYPNNTNYFPTTDSDVPGTIQVLYWKDGTQTWYPKTRRKMNTSTTKWPVGAKFIQTAHM